jgi:serpin B
MCARQLDVGAQPAHSHIMAWFPSRLPLAPCLAFESIALRGRWLAVGAGLLLAPGCGSTGGQTGDEHSDGSGSIEELTGSAQRLAASGDLPNAASADGWNFGWKLYAEQADPAANTFFSPYSISTAASMLFAGAAGQTQAEMQSALEFSTDGEAFHQARNSVALALDARTRAATEEQNAQTLRVVNDLWLEPSFRPLPAFLNTLSAYYGASAFLAPFQTNPEAARLAINDKVARDTEGLIADLLPQNSVNDAAMVLTNALYFKARWSYEFDPLATADAPFAAQSGQSVPVPMMHVQLVTGQVVSDDYTALAVPYDQDQLELVAIMPAPGTFDAFVGSLDAASVTRIAGELAPASVDLSFPKLTIEAEVPLKERLIALGMRSAFEAGDADFSALTDGSVVISDAFHRATISIDEEGTEAAAATAIILRPTSVPDRIVQIVLDRPFVFFVRDVETNVLLFVGHYANP